MYYILKIGEDKFILAEDCYYHLYNEELHEIKILGVIYGSNEYELLKEKLNIPFDIELVESNSNKTFARLSEVTLDNVEYHLKDDDVNFYGTFKEYAEDTDVVGDYLK